MSPEDLAKAERRAMATQVPLFDVIEANGFLTPDQLAKTAASADGRDVVDLLKTPPDARLVDAFGADRVLSLEVLPWRRAGASTIIAARNTDAARHALPALQATFGEVSFVIAPRCDMENALVRQRGPVMAWYAERCTNARESCRNWSGTLCAAVILASLLCLMILGAVYPGWLTLGLTAWAGLTLFAVTGLRTLAATTELLALRKNRRDGHAPAAMTTPEALLPVISVLVPLYKEREIAGHLIRHLKQFDYPVEKQDICLILEAGDDTTRATIEETDIPPWMRVISVPPGSLQTKPRAMNYALDFAKGEIIGVYDAEDAPAPDQLRQVVEKYSKCAPDVACLQGVLDFYNARQNWLTRCFTIDYATWFRLVLPGLARLGMIIPLGGTTLFFRRDVLEKIGRWDAHNVTEDADLGIRLARRGYRTEFVTTVTHEEATSGLRAWIKQRSRWIKGYAVTWAVHMRAPRTLWRELGPKKFLGFQIIFLGTLSQFVLAPLLWSFWLVLIGMPHPFTDIAPGWVMILMGSMFLLAEVATIVVGALAVARPSHRWLVPWVPLMHFYFPLAAVASWKGFAELVTRPFYWDKTTHGASFAKRPVRLLWRRLRRPA